MNRITETQFRSLCDELYRDREQIYEFNPSATHAEVLLWMVLGSLVSLLSLSDEGIPIIAEPTVANYLETICAVVKTRQANAFDPRQILNDFIALAEGTKETEEH